MTGFFFYLASAEDAGLLFCPATIQPHTSVYSAFCAVHATIPQTQQNSAQGLTGAFPAICRVFPLLCGGVSSYTAQPAPRWSVSHTPGRPAPDTRYHRHAGRCTGQRSRPIIIMYIRAHGCSRSQTVPARRGLDASHAWH